MDLPVKSESNLDETLSEEYEFMDEKPIKQNLAISDKNLNSEEQKELAPKLRRPSEESGELSYHARKILLRAFQKEGCIPETVDKYSNVYNYNVKMAKEYFANAAREAEEYVHEECDSLSFNNITEWLKYLKVIGAQQQCNYEAAIILNAIANNECHPDPVFMNGINLKAIYNFLSNALMGLPQPELDQMSARFLSSEFQNLIDEANTDEADNDVRNMKAQIEKYLGCTLNLRKSFNLDPLNTHAEDLVKSHVHLKQE